LHQKQRIHSIACTLAGHGRAKLCFKQRRNICQPVLRDISLHWQSAAENVFLLMWKTGTIFCFKIYRAKRTWQYSSSISIFTENNLIIKCKSESVYFINCLTYQHTIGMLSYSGNEVLINHDKKPR